MTDCNEQILIFPAVKGKKLKPSSMEETSAVMVVLCSLEWLIKILN